MKTLENCAIINDSAVFIKVMLQEREPKVKRNWQEMARKELSSLNYKELNSLQEWQVELYRALNVLSARVAEKIGMRFDIITIFPDLFDSWLKESLIARGRKKKLIEIKVHNLRKWASVPHRMVDDRPFGGGRGMVLKVEPLYKAVSTLSKLKVKSSKLKVKRKIILFTPRGKRFNQKMAAEWAKLGQIILICGRYEGVDERVAKYVANEVVSVGDFVLMGGELAALMVIETVARLVPGVVGKSKELISQRLTKEKGFVEYPQYTRPEVFEPTKGIKNWRVPKVLLSGNHKKIEEWREKHSRVIE